MGTCPPPSSNVPHPQILAGGGGASKSTASIRHYRSFVDIFIRSIISPSSSGDYPFELRAVQKDGLTCSWCPWYRFCRGCLISCSDQEFGNTTSYLAIEWDPTTLHLRYQSSQEKSFVEHESLEKSRKLQTEPIDLYECLRAFTKEEELGEDELW